MSPTPVAMTPGRLPAKLAAWRLTAWIAGVFSGLLALTMVIGHAGVRAEDPLKSPHLKTLKEQLRSSPKDERVKEEIRKLDLALRERYFLQISRMQTGVYLLLGGAALFVFATLRGRVNTRSLPNLSEPLDERAREKTATLSRYSVALAGALAGIGLFAGSSALTGTFTGRATAADVGKLIKGQSAVQNGGPDAASIEELRKNWPRFLGPDGNNFSSTATPIEKWDVENGAGIVWKQPVPTHGFNSPIVWGNRIFFSGGDAAKREVVCLDAQTGKVLWQEALVEVPGSPAQMPEIPEMTGFAASSMATDGRRVYVIFANGDLAAYQMDGKRVWAKYVGPLENVYGYANSLATWRDKVIVQLDQGDSEGGKSKLVAFDGRTGQPVWQKARKVGASWSSPTVFQAADKWQIVVLSIPWAWAYNAEDGAELWKADCLNGEITPSPIFSGGLVVVPSPSDRLLGIRPDGQGDVTKSHMAWANEDSVPDVTSPAGNGELIFMLTTSGLLTCVDNKDGKRAWEHDFELEFHSSPAIAGDKVFLFGQKGAAVVVEAARSFKEVFRAELPDSFHASPAFVDGKIYLRGVTNVWCLGK